MTHNKPHAPACDNNKAPILAVMQRYMSDDTSGHVLEIGSGTGQHAVHFCAAFPMLQWWPTDAWDIAGIEAWRADSQLSNLHAPRLLDVTQADWQLAHEPDYVFTANTFHIMSWASVQAALVQVGRVLAQQGTLMVYGPFNYQGQYTAPSNARFDQWLKQRNPDSGIRDFEAVCDCAEQAGMNLLADHEMPANNRFLVFQRR